MSWSISFIGTPEKVSAALISQAEKMQDQSKVEYTDALPHLVGLVSQNFNMSNANAIIQITASGSGYLVDGNKFSRNCSVHIQQIYGYLV